MLQLFSLDIDSVCFNGSDWMMCGSTVMIGRGRVPGRGQLNVAEMDGRRAGVRTVQVVAEALGLGQTRGAAAVGVAWSGWGGSK